MFKLADPGQSYSHKVTVSVPVGSNSWRQDSFVAQFKMLPTPEFRELFTTEHLASVSDQQVIGRFLVGWSDICTHDGGELVFSDAALKQLCSIRYWAQAVVEAYLDFYTGQPAKNLQTPLGTG